MVQYKRKCRGCLKGIYSIYKDRNIMDDIKIRRLGWAGHIISVGEESIPQKYS